MLLIESDKRSSDYELPLTYSPDRLFHVPRNVHIIGMMNTADRSLAMVDYALRRRFAFVSLSPTFGDKFIQFLESKSVSSELATQIRQRMEQLNEEIAKDVRDLGRGYRIGHSYFCPSDPVENEAEWYDDVIDTEIAPLLEEYWADESPDKVRSHIDRLKGE